MKKEVTVTGAALLTLAACIVPPSMYESATWGTPPGQWQANGRYRQDPGAPTPPDAADPAPQAGSGGQPASVEGAADGPQPPLYSWDGGVVDGAPQGSVTPQDGSPRGLETPPAGRMHIIELYQQVLDERDALAQEVERLRLDLEQTRLALEARTKAADELTAQVAALEASHKGLLADNQDIAARLVQAQIRRLEAEKLLLETRIEVERQKAEEAARAAQAARPGAAKPAGKPRSTEKGSAPEERGGDE